MKIPLLIDQALLDSVSLEACRSPRQRKNRNFHADDAARAHRLLNAIEPGSYLMPHRHLDANKDETMIVLRGRLGVVFFDQLGQVQQTVVLAPTGPVCGVDIPHGVYHTILALDPGTVMLEAKGGPYLPLDEAERAPWAPAEGAPEVAAYARSLRERFA
ncbi:cupin fold metalloprotein, WbuC family [Candidatus Accumulibacter phosphatis]|jgi:cupin fold WbuC family metalloprotein|uniref:Cupin fold metalloprotein, WbuC family n=1 Tax=Candidatus Accumulibacter phosphatis TaxID=327160 RepID=A0ABX1TTH9_9PROT|nr:MULTISPECIES: WbuC family cupin fold metalloprotein [Candidatus Accumulibacter]NMQ26751.1 cupin fold metalloprotein, WbuC family [Candidatus Accumulibacter phosphatis]